MEIVILDLGKTSILRKKQRVIEDIGKQSFFLGSAMRTGCILRMRQRYDGNIMEASRIFWLQSRIHADNINFINFNVFHFQCTMFHHVRER